MSYFLKRTKKSCLKFLQKISPSKQLFVNKLEEEEEEDVSSSHIERLNSLDETRASENWPAKISNHEKCIKIEQNYTTPEFENEIDAELKRQSYSFIEETLNNNNNNNDDTILQSITSRLFLTADGYEFRRLQQLRSDTASEVIQFEPEHDALGEIVFEKVKFKKHVRYLQHTPSNSSLDNFSTANSMSSLPDCLYIAAKAAVPLEGAFSNGCPPQTHSVSKYRQLQVHHAAPAPAPKLQNLPINVGLGSRSDGNYQHVIISERPDACHKLTPVIRWDINGNSLDDVDDTLAANDNWEDFASRRKHLFENIMDSDDSQKSSRRSSSTTLETWLEEEFP